MRYTMIDSNTGFVWGSADGSSPVEACEAMDLEISDDTGNRGYYELSWREIARAEANEFSGYFVYLATDEDTGSVDGQDPDYIHNVEARECVAFVRVTAD